MEWNLYILTNQSDITMKLTKKNTRAKCDRLYQKATKYATEVSYDVWPILVVEIIAWNTKGNRIMRRISRIA